MGDENDKKGFAGLSSLTSEIEKPAQAAVPDQSSRTDPTGGEPAHDQADKTSGVNQTSPNPVPKSSSSGWVWFVGIAAVILIFASYNSNKSNKQNAPTSSFQAETTSQSSGNSAILDTIVQPTPAPVPTPEAQSSQPNITFVLPPVGRDEVLSLAEIRWCLREEIRIDVKRPLIDTDVEVSVFNQSVEYYNQRCVSFRYREGNLQAAEKQVEAFRFKIAEDAADEFTPTPQPTQENQPSAKTVREVQKILTDLGYNPGPVDGQYGQKTAKAIKKFQLEYGHPTSSTIDGNLLSWLRSALDKALEESQHNMEPTGIPANANLDYTGQKWVCNKGYRPEGDRCVK